MGRAARTDVDLETFKRDYEGGMTGKDLEAKYSIGVGSAAKWARQAGCVIRGQREGMHNAAGRRGVGNANGNELLRKLERKSALVEHRLTVPIDEPAEAAPNGHAKARVVMFEISGEGGTVLAAIETVKAALAP